jgi:hypothetical protein
MILEEDAGEGGTLHLRCHFMLCRLSYPCAHTFMDFSVDKLQRPVA